MKMNDIKNDVKKLLQEHVKTNAGTQEISSPHAKYNSRGQLMCIVCGVPVKSKIIWQAHVNKRSHKENLTRLKEKQEKISQLQYQKSEKKECVKKRALSPNNSNSKHVPKNNKMEKPKGILKNVSTHSSSEEESDEDTKPQLNILTNEIKTEPGHDANGKELEKNSSDITERKKDSKSHPSTSDSLPEGFFDDPVADAKARNVEYRDKDAEEWESFMKEVSAAEMESRQIIAEDKVEAALETQLEQANEQIKCLERIVELDKAKQCQLSDKKASTMEAGSDESSDEEFCPVIWRTKNSLI